jgi:hypothetical protein
MNKKETIVEVYRSEKAKTPTVAFPIRDDEPVGIPIDKTKLKIEFVGETEDSVTIVIKHKD